MITETFETPAMLICHEENQIYVRVYVKEPSPDFLVEAAASAIVTAMVESPLGAEAAQERIMKRVYGLTLRSRKIDQF